MGKRGEIVIVVIIVIILASLNLYLYFNKGSFSYLTLSGMATSEVPKLPGGINFSVIAFIAQWGLLLLIIIIAYVRHLKRKKEEDVKINYSKIKSNRGKSSTDLDVLYDLLKNKKRLKINVIAKTFKIPNEKALEWAKILENSELGVIEYPAFNEPEIMLKEEAEKIGEKKEAIKSEEKLGASKSKDFDSSKTESFGSARNSEEFRHTQKSKISDIKGIVEKEIEQIEKIMHIKHNEENEKRKIEKRGKRRKKK